MPFQPANEDHAVIDCEFALGFDTPFNARTLNHIHSKSASWTERLPASGMVEMDPGESIVQLIPGPTTRALLYANLRPDGSPVWSMRCGFNELMITCSRYTRWARTWDIARDMMMNVVKAAAERENRAVSCVTLHVVDQFVCRDTEYDINATLKRGSWLSDRVFDAGMYWHNNAGWFASDASGTVLNTLNVAVSGEPSSYTLSILHQQQLRIDEAGRQSTADPDALERFIETSMQKLHQGNKSMLLSLLHDDLVSAVKLTGTPS